MNAIRPFNQKALGRISLPAGARNSAKQFQYWEITAAPRSIVTIPALQSAKKGGDPRNRHDNPMPQINLPITLWLFL
ncbi:MAG: hypothetical protein M3X11_22200 [Acidobacteriota bacterium]|nr:hypothetical protein [Acidobacteriota bacterium]